MSRRQFLATAAAGVTMTALPLAWSRQAAAQTGPRSLVCLMLQGGADSANMYIPFDNTVAGRTYADYAATRGGFAVPRAAIAPIGNGDFGFNNLLPSLAAMDDAGRICTVRNVGPLERPLTRQEFLADISIPESLFAHDAQRKLWQTARTRLAYSQGWGGRMSAVLNGGADVAPSFSLRGSNIWQAAHGGPYTRLSPTVSVEPVRGFGANGVGDVLQTSLDAAAESANAIERQLARSIANVVLTAQDLEAATANRPENDVGMGEVADLVLGAQLQQVARLILNRDALGMGRQLFFVAMDGWDTHGQQAARFPLLLDELDRSLAAFQTALDHMGVSDSVVTFTVSDFGRTLTSNGDGTDHGWGGHAFVIGDAVTSSAVGKMPDYRSVGNEDDTGDRSGNFGGRWIPTTSVAQYGATLARWMGLSDNQLDQVFPALANFGTRDLGFLGSGSGGQVAGDVNCDGVAGRDDAEAVLDFLVGNRSGGACQGSATGPIDLAAADVDGDGAIDLRDARALLD